MCLNVNNFDPLVQDENIHNRKCVGVNTFIFEAKKKSKCVSSLKSPIVPPLKKKKKSKKKKQKKHPKSLECLFHSAERRSNEESQLTCSRLCHPISFLSLPISSHQFAGYPVCSVFCYFFFLPTFESGRTVTRTAGAFACLH